MWYVIQVRTGAEESIQIQCQKKISEDILEKSFIPYYEEQKRIRGIWTTQKKVLFPGYVFLVTEKLVPLYECLKKVIGMTKLLGTDDAIVALRDEEVKFLEQFGGEEQVVEMSEGIIENSRIRVMSGPLIGYEGYIKKIDRHKRKAYLEVPMFGRVQSVQVGLEIVEKTS